MVIETRLVRMLDHILVGWWDIDDLWAVEKVRMCQQDYNDTDEDLATTHKSK